MGSHEAGAGEAVTIRRAGPRDAEECRAIYAPCVENTVIPLEEVAPTADEMAARIAKTAALWPWLIAERAGSVAGYAYANEHSARAGYRWSANVSVYVGAQDRGTGVGTMLYRALFAVLEYQGYHRAHAGISLPNDASTALHRSVGFELVGVYPEVGFKFGAWHDVAWWWRALQPSRPNAGAPVPPIAMAAIDDAVLERFGIQAEPFATRG